MAKMRQLIYSDNEILHTYGCQAHAINLVAKDVSKMCKDSVSKVVAVLKHLRNHHEESALMKEIKLPRPPLPIETRWNSLADSLDYFVTHRSAISEIFEKTLKVIHYTDI